MTQIKFRLSDAELERVIRAMPEGESVPAFARRKLLEFVDDTPAAPQQVPGQTSIDELAQVANDEVRDLMVRRASSAAARGAVKPIPKGNG